MQPGQTITPGDQPEQPIAPESSVIQEVPAQSTPTPQAGPSSPPQFEQPQPAFADQPYDDVDAVSWSASEFVAHQKSGSWFLVLAMGTSVFSAGIYLVTKDILATIAIAVAGVMFGVFAARAPRVLQYVIDDRGLSIGERLYPYGEIRSFAVLEESPIPSILVMPMKRFLPPITLFFTPEEADKIIDALAARLPHEDKQPDAVDRLMSRIRF